MLTTGEFQRRRGPLIRAAVVGRKGGGPSRARFKTHACLLSSGFCRRVYASSASERFVSRIAEDDEDNDDDDWCRFALPWATALRLRLATIDGPRATWLSFSLLRSFPPSSFHLPSQHLLAPRRPSCPSPRRYFIPLLTLLPLSEPASRNRSYSNILHLWNILKSPFHSSSTAVSNQPIVSAASSRFDTESLYLPEHLDFSAGIRSSAASRPQAYDVFRR